MKIASLTLAAVILGAALASPALAADKGTGPAASPATEFSASKKKVRSHVYSPFYKYVDPYTGDVITRYRPDYLVPSSDFEGGAYAGEYAWRRSIGQCVEDLGYGRFKFC
jgi:hypothetical protein